MYITSIVATCQLYYYIILYRLNEVVSSWHSLKATSDAESELIASEQQKVGAIPYTVGCGRYMYN